MDFLGSAKLRTGQRQKHLGEQNDVDHQITGVGPPMAKNEHEASSVPRNDLPEQTTALSNESPYPVNSVQPRTGVDASSPSLYHSASYDFSVSLSGRYVSDHKGAIFFRIMLPTSSFHYTSPE